MLTKLASGADTLSAWHITVIWMWNFQEINNPLEKDSVHALPLFLTLVAEHGI